MTTTITNDIPGITQAVCAAITGAAATPTFTLNGTSMLAGSVQCISGTPGSITIQVSNDGTNWATLKDVHGTDIALTALTQVADFCTAALYIRALGNGSTSSAVVKFVFRGES